MPVIGAQPVKATLASSPSIAALKPASKDQTQAKIEKIFQKLAASTESEYKSEFRGNVKEAPEKGALLNTLFATVFNQMLSSTNADEKFCGPDYEEAYKFNNPFEALEHFSLSAVFNAIIKWFDADIQRLKPAFLDALNRIADKHSQFKKTCNELKDKLSPVNSLAVIEADAIGEQIEILKAWQSGGFATELNEEQEHYYKTHYDEDHKREVIQQIQTAIASQQKNLIISSYLIDLKVTLEKLVQNEKVVPKKAAPVVVEDQSENRGFLDQVQQAFNAVFEVETIDFGESQIRLDFEKVLAKIRTDFDHISTFFHIYKKDDQLILRIKGKNQDRLEDMVNSLAETDNEFVFDTFGSDQPDFSSDGLVFLAEHPDAQEIKSFDEIQLSDGTAVIPKVEYANIVFSQFIDREKVNQTIEQLTSIFNPEKVEALKDNILNSSESEKKRILIQLINHYSCLNILDNDLFGEDAILFEEGIEQKRKISELKITFQTLFSEFGSVFSDYVSERQTTILNNIQAQLLLLNQKEDISSSERQLLFQMFSEFEYIFAHIENTSELSSKFEKVKQTLEDLIKNSNSLYFCYFAHHFLATYSPEIIQKAIVHQKFEEQIRGLVIQIRLLNEKVVKPFSEESEELLQQTVSEILKAIQQLRQNEEAGQANWGCVESAIKSLHEAIGVNKGHWDQSELNKMRRALKEIEKNLWICNGLVRPQKCSSPERFCEHYNINDDCLKGIHSVNDKGQLCIQSGSIKYTVFTDLKPFGEGTFGKVFLAKDSEGNEFACKQYFVNDPGAMSTNKRINSLWRRISKQVPNIIELHHMFIVNVPEPTLFVFMEKAYGDICTEIENSKDLLALPLSHKKAATSRTSDKKNGTLPNSMRRSAPFDQDILSHFEDYLSLFFLQIAVSIKALHEKAKYVHRDLKPQNIMMTEDGICKIADFDTLEELGRKMPVTGTYSYMPPAVNIDRIKGKSEPNDAYRDYFALAAILFEQKYTTELYTLPMQFKSIRKPYFKSLSDEITQWVAEADPAVREAIELDLKIFQKQSKLKTQAQLLHDLLSFKSSHLLIKDLPVVSKLWFKINNLSYSGLEKLIPIDSIPESNKTEANLMEFKKYLLNCIVNLHSVVTAEQIARQFNCIFGIEAVNSRLFTTFAENIEKTRQIFAMVEDDSEVISDREAFFKKTVKDLFYFYSDNDFGSLDRKLEKRKQKLTEEQQAQFKVIQKKHSEYSQAHGAHQLSLYLTFRPLFESMNKGKLPFELNDLLIDREILQPIISQKTDILQEAIDESLLLLKKQIVMDIQSGVSIIEESRFNRDDVSRDYNLDQIDTPFWKSLSLVEKKKLVLSFYSTLRACCKELMIQELDKNSIEYIIFNLADPDGKSLPQLLAEEGNWLSSRYKKYFDNDVLNLAGREKAREACKRLRIFPEFRESQRKLDADFEANGIGTGDDDAQKNIPLSNRREHGKFSTMARSAGNKFAAILKRGATVSARQFRELSDLELLREDSE